MPSAGGLRLFGGGGGGSRRRLYISIVVMARQCASAAAAQMTTRIATIVKADSEQPQRWDIFAGVALLRAPLIAPQMSEVEQRYTNIIQQIEQRQSLKSNFELRHLKDAKLLAKRAQLEAEGKELSALDEEIGLTAEAQHDDWARRAETLRKQYAIGDISKVEEKSETSLRRKLDEKLFLLVRQKFSRADGYSSPWILPQMANRVDENLRQTAERCIAEIVDGSVDATVQSNAPFAVYSYRYPSGLRKNLGVDTIGAKVFFYNALISPQQSQLKMNGKEIYDYKWVTADEFAKLVRSRTYRNSVSTLFLR